MSAKKIVQPFNNKGKIKIVNNPPARKQTELTKDSQPNKIIEEKKVNKDIPKQHDFSTNELKNLNKNPVPTPHKPIQNSNQDLIKKTGQYNVRNFNKSPNSARGNTEASIKLLTPKNPSINSEVSPKCITDLKVIKESKQISDSFADKKEDLDIEAIYALNLESKLNREVQSPKFNESAKTKIEADSNIIPISSEMKDHEKSSYPFFEQIKLRRYAQKSIDSNESSTNSSFPITENIQKIVKNSFNTSEIESIINNKKLNLNQLPSNIRNSEESSVISMSERRSRQRTLNFNKQIRESSSISRIIIKPNSIVLNNPINKSESSLKIENFLDKIENYLKHSSNFAEIDEDLVDISKRMENIERFIRNEEKSNEGKEDNISGLKDCIGNKDKQVKEFKICLTGQLEICANPSFKEKGNYDDDDDLGQELNYLKEEYDKLQEKLFDGSEYIEKIEIENRELRDEIAKVKLYAFECDQEIQILRNKGFKLENN